MSLQLANVSVTRGRTAIVHGVSLDAPAGDVTLLLGANGTGKTTLLEAISGLLACDGGDVKLHGDRVNALSPVRRAGLGLGHVQQGRAVFAAMTVEENLRVGARGRDVASAFTLFPELRKRRRVFAGALSGGEQQMLVLARAIAARPRVLLVDELSLGLAPTIVRRLMPVLRGLADDGVAVLLVEQFAHLALTIGNHVYVMRGGRICASGAGAEFLREPNRLRDAYLGRHDAGQHREIVNELEPLS